MLAVEYQITRMSRRKEVRGIVNRTHACSHSIDFNHLLHTRRLVWAGGPGSIRIDFNSCQSWITSQGLKLEANLRLFWSFSCYMVKQFSVLHPLQLAIPALSRFFDMISLRDSLQERMFTTSSPSSMDISSQTSTSFSKCSVCFFSKSLSITPLWIFPRISL